MRGIAGGVAIGLGLGLAMSMFIGRVASTRGLSDEFKMVYQVRTPADKGAGEDTWEEAERYLRKKAADGWRLHGTFGVWFVFERQEVAEKLDIRGGPLIIRLS